MYTTEELHKWYKEMDNMVDDAFNALCKIGLDVTDIVCGCRRFGDEYKDEIELAEKAEEYIDEALYYLEQITEGRYEKITESKSYYTEY